MYVSKNRGAEGDSAGTNQGEAEASILPCASLSKAISSSSAKIPSELMAPRYNSSRPSVLPPYPTLHTNKSHYINFILHRCISP